MQVIMTKRAEYNDIVKQTNICLCNTMTSHRTGMKSLLYHTQEWLWDLHMQFHGQILLSTIYNAAADFSHWLNQFWLLHIVLHKVVLSVKSALQFVPHKFVVAQISSSYLKNVIRFNVVYHSWRVKRRGVYKNGLSTFPVLPILKLFSCLSLFIHSGH